MYIVTIDNWSMKKNFLNLFIVLLTAGVGLGLTACSSDEESVENVNTEPTKEPAEVQASCVEDTALNEAGQNAVGMVVGKWRLTKVGIDDYTETETYLTFTPDGKVMYEIAVNTDDYRYQESERGFEDDWVSDSENGLTGHIQFNMHNMSSRPVERFICSLNGTEMILCPDMDMRYVKDPTMYFVKVE